MRQVRSGHQGGFADPTSEKFTITSELELFHGMISSLQIFITVPVCVICLSQNFYICDLLSGQSRDLDITTLREIMKCGLLRVNESKLPNSFIL